MDRRKWVKFTNSNSEIRNPKQIEIRKSKFENEQIVIKVFRFSNFVLVSDFEIRISDLGSNEFLLITRHLLILRRNSIQRDSGLILYNDPRHLFRWGGTTAGL